MKGIARGRSALAECSRPPADLQPDSALEASSMCCDAIRTSF